MADNYRPTVPPLHEATVTDWIRHHIERSLGITRPTMAEIEESVRNSMSPDFERARREVAGRAVGLLGSAEFDAYRRARLRMGHLRYSGLTGWHQRDLIPGIRARWSEYVATGNRELLVDVVNLLDIEWGRPTRPDTYWAFRFSYYPRALLLGEALSTYAKCANRVYLAIAANAAELEFCYPTHPKAHFAASDCGGHPSLRDDGEP